MLEAADDILVVAAGGIADGRGLAAVLMVCAAGAWMGTRFVASRDWGGGPWEQRAVLAAGSAVPASDRASCNRAPRETQLG